MHSEPGAPGLPLRPWHLPGGEAATGAGEGDRREHRGTTAGGAAFETPRLSRSAATRVAESVRASALRARDELSLDAVVEAVSTAATRLADPEGAAGQAAVRLLAAELAWSEALVAETLSEMAAVWHQERLRELLAGELPDPGVLEEYRGDERRRRRAAGPPLLFVVHAANVPGVAVTAVVRGLLVGSGVLCKAPEGEPGLLALFARTLADVEPRLGDAVATTWWPGDQDVPVWDVWTKRAGKAVVYGGSSAVRSVRDRLPPETDLVVYGPRIGVGVVLPDAAEAAARTGSGESGAPEPEPARAQACRLARDVCAYEQQGCVSPRLVFVVGAPPRPFAEALAEALRQEVARLPRPEPSVAEAVSIRAARAEEEFRGYEAPAPDEAGPRVLGAGDDLSWTVIVGGEEPLRSRGLRRVVRVHGVESLSALERLLAPLEGRIQAVGYAGRRGLDELAGAAVRLGVARLAPFGRMAWPPADWRHDGRHQLLPLLQWTDWEG